MPNIAVINRARVVAVRELPFPVGAAVELGVSVDRCSPQWNVAPVANIAVDSAVVTRVGVVDIDAQLLATAVGPAPCHILVVAVSGRTTRVQAALVTPGVVERVRCQLAVTGIGHAIVVREHVLPFDVDATRVDVGLYE